MMEQLKRYWEIARLALLQEKAAKDSKIKGMNEHEKEFLPAVLEVTEMPPSHAARLLTCVIMLMFMVLILWSILGKIDIIATSAGKLMPASNIKTIQTLTDSEIEEIYVQEGQYVKEGQRRLEIARALATEPTLLLLDEPAAGMNPQETLELAEFIKEIRDHFHKTILLIEHHMDLVMGIADRIYVLDFGKLIAKGTPEEIQNNERVIDAYLGVAEDAED